MMQAGTCLPVCWLHFSVHLHVWVHPALTRYLWNE